MAILMERARSPFNKKTFILKAWFVYHCGGIHHYYASRICL